MSIQTPYGPLSISDHYAIIPAVELSRSLDPAEQYATNWLSFELTGPQPVTVDGSVIRIGEMAIDPTSLGDVVLTVRSHDGDAGTEHLIRAGDPVHDVLAPLRREYDDGVLILIYFTDQERRRIADIGSPLAEAVVAEMDRWSLLIVRPALS